MGNGLSVQARVRVMCRARIRADLMSPVTPVGFPAKSAAVDSM